MNKKLLLILATAMLFCGWFSAFMLNGVPQQETWYILAPTLLLGVGMGLFRKNSCWKKTALAVIFTALTALLFMNQFFPDRRVTVSAVKQRFQNSQAGKMVSVTVKDSERNNAFEMERSLEAFAPIKVRLFAQLPGAVRMLTTDQEGNLYVTIPSLGAVYKLWDSDGDGFANESILYHVGLDRPSGILWDDDKLYVTEPAQLLELRDTNHDNQVDQVMVVTDNLPDDGGHWTRSIAKNGDGFIYLAVGSRCNACEEDDPKRATVLKIDPLTGQTDIFARGLRNTVGLTFAPDNKTLWGTDSGRNGMGTQLPPDEINRITSGGDYGWPFCYGNKLLDRELGSGDRCENTVASSVDLPAQSNPMGITFGATLNAPEMYRNSMYVVLNGTSESNATPAGRIIRIPYGQDEIGKHGKEFLSGWEFAGESWGKPVAIIVGNDGNLYLSDEQAQAIYQISWQQIK